MQKVGPIRRKTRLKERLRAHVPLSELGGNGLKRGAGRGPFATNRKQCLVVALNAAKKKAAKKKVAAKPVKKSVKKKKRNT